MEISLFQSLDLKNDKSEKLTHGASYRQLIGSLLHLTNTVRSDIYFPVDCLSQFSYKSNEILWKAEKHILRYLIQTKNPRIVYD